MLSAFLQRERDQLLGQLQSGKPHTEAFRRAIEGAFDIADTFDAERRNLSDRPVAERKAEMAQIVDGDLLPRLASLTAPARKAKGQVEAERARHRGINLSADVSGLFDDIGRVEAATYFAQREMQPASALSAYAFHNVMTSETSR